MNIITKYDPYTGTLFDNDDRLQKSIFVSIVSYRDKNIINTINSLLANAKRPQNITISIVIAAFLSEEKWTKNLENLYENNKNNIILKIIDCRKNINIGELKKIADSAYNKENYYMSISSRSEFDPNWDDILIKQYSEIKNNLLETDVVFTAEPRKYLSHDDVVKGFVYYTNHKTKISMQREESDASRIPISGYNYFINNNNLLQDASFTNKNENFHEILFEKDEAKKNEEFLLNNKFIKFGSRKFTKNEYIAISIGICYKFIFCESKIYYKNNIYPSNLVDMDQYNFYTYINMIKNNLLILSIRWVPVYYLCSELDNTCLPERSPRDFYTNEEYKNLEGTQSIIKLIDKTVIGSQMFDMLLAVDWKEKRIKSRQSIPKNFFVDCINSFISLYNFSIYENSLHWNKKC